MDGPRPASTSLRILAALGVIGGLYLLRAILVPIALSLLLACLLAPVTAWLRRLLRVGPVGAAVVLFLLLTVFGLYLASLTAESLVQAANTLPGDLERLALRISHRLTDAIRDHPYLGAVLPEPGTIDQLGSTHRELLMQGLTYRLGDLTEWVGHGLVVLFLVLFLLAEYEMLTPKVVGLIAPATGDGDSAARTLRAVSGRIRAYLLARTVLNIGFGTAVAVALWLMGIDFPVVLGVFAGVTNYIPYIGNVAGGALPVLVTLGQRESLGDALLVAAVYLGIVAVEGYVIMPYVMGRSLDLNGTTVLVACLFWGFLWGLPGLILAMPITVSLKLICQYVPGLQGWAQVMSRDPTTSPARRPDSLPPISVSPASSPPATPSESTLPKSGVSVR